MRSVPTKAGDLQVKLSSIDARSDHNHLPLQLSTKSMNGQYLQPAVVSGVAGYGAVLLLKMGHKPGVRQRLGTGEIRGDWAQLRVEHISTSCPAS